MNFSIFSSDISRTEATRGSGHLDLLALLHGPQALALWPANVKPGHSSGLLVFSSIRKTSDSHEGWDGGPIQKLS